MTCKHGRAFTFCCSECEAEKAEEQERQNPTRPQDEHTRLTNERDQFKNFLSNLLARIHGDGGHHEQEVGLEQAVKDADEKIVDLQSKKLRFDLDQTSIEQREADAVELVELRAEVIRVSKKYTDAKAAYVGLMAVTGQYEQKLHDLLLRWLTVGQVIEPDHHSTEWPMADHLVSDTRAALPKPVLDTMENSDDDK